MNVEVTVHLADLNTDAVSHLVPDGATRVSVEIFCRASNLGRVRLVWYDLDKNTGKPYGRYTAREWALTPDWFDSLTAGGGMGGLRSALDSERNVEESFMEHPDFDTEIQP